MHINLYIVFLVLLFLLCMKDLLWCVFHLQGCGRYDLPYKAQQLWNNKEEAKHLLKAFMPCIMAQEVWSKAIWDHGEGAGEEKAGTLATGYIEQYYAQTEKALEGPVPPREEARTLASALSWEYGIRHEVISLDKEQAKMLEERGDMPGAEGIEPETEREGRTLKVDIQCFQPWYWLELNL